MKWVRDNTGRFPQRPYYDALELDSECENLISSIDNLVDAVENWKEDTK